MRTMFLKIAYRLRTVIDHPRAWIRWDLDPSFDNDLELVSGSWRLLEIDPQRSLGLFGTAVRVGAALPAFLQKQVTRSKLPTPLTRCRKWADSGG